MKLRGCAGYSLFEVLVAFAIMTLVLSALLPGQSRLLQRVGSTEDRTLAMDYAVSLADLAALTPVTEWVTRSYKHRDWKVSQSILDAADAQRRLVIEVRSQEGVTLARTEVSGRVP